MFTAQSQSWAANSSGGQVGEIQMPAQAASLVVLVARWVEGKGQRRLLA